MSFWTDERKETLKKAWLEGRSAREIANLLGHPSRSAVIGMVHRLGLSGDSGGRTTASSPGVRAPAPLPPKKPQRQVTAAKPAARNGWGFNRPTPAAPVAAKVVPLPVSRSPERDAIARTAYGEPCQLLQLRSVARCRWMCDGEGADAHYCNARTDGGPWCTQHATLVFNASAKRMSKRDLERIASRAR